MIFGKYINRYYLRHAPTLLLGIAALILVDYMQLIIPELYRMLINGVNSGQVLVGGVPTAFTKQVLMQNVCLPMIGIIVSMVIGRFLWRICFSGRPSGWRPSCATGCSITARTCPRPITR